MKIFTSKNLHSCIKSKIKNTVQNIGPETAQGRLLGSAVHNHNPKEAAKLISGFMENLPFYMPEALVAEIQNSVLRNRDIKINEKGITQGSADSMFAFSSSDKYGLDRRAKRYVTKDNDPNVIRYRKNVIDAKKNLNNSPYTEVTFEDIRDGKVYNEKGENSSKIAKAALTKGVVDTKGNTYKIGGVKGKQSLQKKSEGKDKWE